MVRPLCARPVPLIAAAAAVTAAALAALATPAPTPVPTVAGVSWEDLADLAPLSAEGRTLRYVAPGVAVVEAVDDEAIRAAGRPVLFLDRRREGEGYYLSDHLHAGPLPDHVRMVYRDPRGWGLMRLPRARLVETLEDEHFLFPLPATYAPPLPAAAARPAAREPSAQVRALVDQVDAARLRATVDRLVFHDPEAGAVAGNVRTRYARRPETFASTQWLRQELAAVLGPEAVLLDTFRVDPSDSLMYNVVAELPGTDPEAGYWVVCAHYDAIGTRTRRTEMTRIGEDENSWQWRQHPAPGADDNASGVAVVLESARLLAQQRFPFSIRFIAWSGEELGLWGSRDYALRARARDDRVLGVLNFDMVGFNDLTDRLELVTNPASTWLVTLMRDTADRYRLGLRIDVLEDPFAGLSDHQSFWASGYDAVLGIENYLPTDSLSAGVLQGDYRINSQYHTVADLPDSISWELVARVTRLTVATLAQFGSEQGLPNLAVHASDVALAPDDRLRVQVRNLGPVDLLMPFTLRVSRCAADSTGCRVLFERAHEPPLAAGAGVDVVADWQDYGDQVLLVEVDPENDIAEEVEDSDNGGWFAVRLVPGRVVAAPSPFRPGVDPYVQFLGVPTFARVTITAADGSLVWSGREGDLGGVDRTREVRWPGTDDSGGFVGEGSYRYEVRDAAGDLVVEGRIQVEAGTAAVVVGPNPWRPDVDAALRVSGAPAGARLHVRALSGELIWQGGAAEPGQTQIRWSGVNQAGFAVGAGIYLYEVRAGGGDLLRRGKIAVVR